MTGQHRADALSLHRNAAGKVPAKPRRKPEPVVTAHVLPDAMATALRLAGGNVRRVYVLDAHTVLILNRERGT